MTPELHRPFAADRVGTHPVDITLEANAAECTALAARMGLPSIAALRCRFVLSRLESRRVEAVGTLHAEIEQVSVVSLDPFTTTVDDQFVIHFVPEAEIPDVLDADGIDEVPYDHGILDLGEAAAEQLALVLDPYPRKPGEMLDQDDHSGPDTPFAALAGMKRVQ